MIGVHEGFGSQSSFLSEASGEAHCRWILPILPVLTKLRQGQKEFGISSKRSAHDTELNEGVHADQSDSS
jgi:hypothetical protein